MSRPAHILLLLCGLLTADLAVASAEIGGSEIRQISRYLYSFEIDGSSICVEIRDPILRQKKDMLLDWVRYSAETVTRYYDRFPVNNVHIDLQPIAGQEIRSGQAFGGEWPRVRVNVGEDTTPGMLRDDWIMVHELAHLAMADVAEEHRWLLEGLATYVESIARARRNHLSEDDVWRYFIERMPQGLPQEGDAGLDHTPTWGRTYWGGAIFFMLADIEIRRQTSNEKSLRDALHGVLDAGLSMHSARTTPLRIFEIGDRRVGADALVPLYEKMKAAPYPARLDGIWKSLGVELDGKRVVFDDSAPKAHIRDALLKPDPAFGSTQASNSRQPLPGTSPKQKL